MFQTSSRNRYDQLMFTLPAGQPEKIAKTKIIKVEIHVTNNVGKLWIRWKKTSRSHFKQIILWTKQKKNEEEDGCDEELERGGGGRRD